MDANHLNKKKINTKNTVANTDIFRNYLHPYLVSGEC